MKRAFVKALCSCGSGRSHRACCAASARAQRLGWQLLGEGRPRAADLEPWPEARTDGDGTRLKAWEVDFLGQGQAGRVLIIVMAGTTVLTVRDMAGPRGLEGRLAAVEAAVLAAADAAGAFPEELRLRDPALAAALSERLARFKVRCRHDLDLYAVDALATDLRRVLDPFPTARPGRGR